MKRREFFAIGATAAGLWLAKRTLAACDTTTTDRYGYGPYYLPDAPERSQLVTDITPGQRLSIRGKVTACGEPASASVEVWQADAKGCYSPHQACSDAPSATRNTHLRALLRPNREGQYTIQSIVPGRYLNGSTYRPRHIHFRISLPASGTGMAWDLVTQLYFAGDPFIAGDYAAGHASSQKRIIALSPDTEAPQADAVSGIFDINLPSGLAAGITRKPFADPLQDPASQRFDGLIRSVGHDKLLHFPGFANGHDLQLTITDALGRQAYGTRLASLPAWVKTQGWPKGIYHAKVSGWLQNRFRVEKMRFALH
jgi:protocatechuate 3,4-dioxygenase beta subunit